MTMQDKKSAMPPSATPEELEVDAGGGVLLPPNGGGKGGSGMSGGMKQPLLAAIAVFIIGVFAMVMLGQPFISRSTFDTNFTNVANDIKTLREAQAGFATQVMLNNYATMQSLADYAKTTDLSNYALTSSLNDYATKAELTNVTPDLSGYVTKVDYDALKSQVEALEDRLGTTTTTGTGTTTSGDVTFALSASPTNPIYSSGVYSYLLSVTNNSGAVKKVYVQATATITSVPAQPPNPDVTIATTNFISGTPSGWNGATTFAMSFSPATGVGCFRISGISDGYLLIANGQTVLVPVTFNLVATTTGSMWQVNFIPIATAF